GAKRGRQRPGPSGPDRQGASPAVRAAIGGHRAAHRRQQRCRGARAARRPRSPLVLVDANLLLFAVDRSSPFHNAARAWLTGALNGAERVGLPWLALGAFLRIVTH